MELRLAPETEAKLTRLAAQKGQDAAAYARELVERCIDHDAWFRSEVQKGFSSIDRGEFVEHDDVVERIERMFHS